jgi:hypothetical protein
MPGTSGFDYHLNLAQRETKKKNIISGAETTSVNQPEGNVIRRARWKLGGSVGRG